MRKMVTAVLAATLALSLAACGGAAEEDKAGSKAGTQNNASTVDKILAEAVNSQTPTATPQTEQTTTPQAELTVAPQTELTPAPSASATVPEATPTPEPPKAEQGEDIPSAPLEFDAPAVAVGAAVDIDLTQLSSTLVYSQVYDMMYSPKEFVGKTVRMEGPAASATVGDTIYHALIIEDATACCQQGMEYKLCGEASYPQDSQRATVTGQFSIYKEGDYIYAVLSGARVEN